MTKEELEKEAGEWSFRKKYTYGYSYTFRQVLDAYIDGAKPREKRIDCLTLACENYREEMEKNLADAVKLEKENAELKDYRLTTLAKQQTENQKYTVNLEHKLSWYDDQLTKAKEIIKTFLGFAEAFGYSPSMDKFISEAEQFLNCSEKPNNYHSKAEQELNLHNALTDYCDM